MKRLNILTIIFLASFLKSCGDQKKNTENLFLIDDSAFKVMYHTEDSVFLLLKNNQNKVIDSVIYYINDKKIGTTKGNIKLDYPLKSEKLGSKNIIAKAYHEGNISETNTKIEVVSSFEPKIGSYTVLKTYPHDANSFTEGLEFHSDFLYEGLGLRGGSKLLKTDYKTGKIIQSVPLSDKYFGEGITIINNKIYQLTWEENTGFIYDLNTMKLEKTFKYDKNIEGWGMTNDGTNIYHTDKTERIWKMNPETQKMIDYVDVYTNSTKIESINELEWIEGKIYANIWQKDTIIIIDPSTGAVETVLDMKNLRNQITNTQEVLNGIAYNPKTKTIFVTGKNWNKMFEIKINN